MGWCLWLLGGGRMELGWIGDRTEGIKPAVNPICFFVFFFVFLGGGVNSGTGLPCRDGWMG